MTDHRTTVGEGALPQQRGNASLPRYSNPPVVEVAISVAFDQLPSFELIHFGLFWERIRSRYPETQHQPALPADIELFDIEGPQQASLRFESGFPVGRCWYLSEDHLRLIQVQPDRFIVNWRKLETQTDYPSYDVLRATFVEELGHFLGFVEEHNLGRFEPTQCELTYVNHILAGHGWNKHSELEKVVALWSGKPSESFLPEIEGLRLAWQYRFDDRGTPAGRVHMLLQSAFSANDQKPLFVLQLAGRGAPLRSDLGEVLAFLDKCHEWIVRGFTAVTTGHMQTIWERQR